jgi:hypothetical protein
MVRRHADTAQKSGDNTGGQHRVATAAVSVAGVEPRWQVVDEREAEETVHRFTLD